MITPKDIEEKAFKKVKIGGYEVKDVEDFLESVIVDYEELYNENTQLHDKCSNMQESITYYKTLEQGIDQTLNKAKEEAEKIRELAIKESANLKTEQELLFKNRLAELESKIYEKEINFENLKKQMDIYKIKLESMLEAQLKILREENEK